MSAPSSEVVERLDRLAGQAPEGSLDPHAVWTRGRRRQRRRWAAATACVAVLAGLGAAGAAPLVRWVDPPVATVPEGAGMVLPDVIRSPGRWEPAFDASPGPLSAVGHAPRGAWGVDRASFWGVSAVTGESRFLDLPPAAPTLQFDSAALSDDGTRLAYWTSLRADGEPIDDTVGEAPSGVAILDLVSGQVRLWDAGMTSGLQTNALVWADDVLWIRGRASRDTDPSRSRAPTTWTWGPDGDPEVAEGAPWGDGMSLAYPGSGGFLVVGGTATHRVRVVEADGDFTTVRLTHDGSTTSEIRVRPDGRLVAGLQQTPRVTSIGSPLPLVVGSVEGNRAAMAPVGDVEAASVWGWRSSTEVVVGAAPLEDVLVISTVDLDNGAVSPLTVIPESWPSTFASDVWAAEVVPAPDAPFAPDPAFFGGGATIVGLLLMASWGGVRRRRGHP